MVRIDMSEYQERHAVSRLVGAPPGYVGYEEGGQLTEAVRRRPYSVILLDEIEKAHPEVFNVLLQVLDDGRLTDNKGRAADFRNTLVIMTSNMGSEVIRERIEAVETFDDKAFADMKEKMGLLLRERLRPEFLNRIDEIVLFRPLGPEQIRRIVDIQYARIEALARRNQNLSLALSSAARDWLAQQGYDPTFGARPLKRLLQQEISNKLAEEILAGRIADGDPVHIDLAPDAAGLTFDAATSAAA